MFYATTIKPISEASKQKIIKSVGETEKLVTVEEHSVIGGIGDEIVRICQGVHFIHRKIGIQDKFLTNYGTYEEHCRANNLTREGVIQTVYEIKRTNH